jgi:2-oxoglutarate dehydrogenase complex dehydrogenase (E1) component-like enzyme
MQITYMTTPANLFHALRRQMHRQFRKREFTSFLCPVVSKQTLANTTS